MRSPRSELLVFGLVAAIGVLPAALQPGAVVGDGVDAFGTWWFYDWIRLAVENGGNPSFTRAFFYPLGKDVFTHTGNNFVDAVLSVPLQWALGQRYSPAWTWVILVGNALTFRPLARMVSGSDERAFAASLLWMVNPFCLFELTAGRPTQAFCWFIPAVPYFLLRLHRGRWEAVKLGVAAALVGWTYWFASFFVGALCIPLLLGRRPPWQRLLLAGVVAVVLVLPAAFPMASSWEAGLTPGGNAGEQSIFALPGAVANSVGNSLHGLFLMEFYGAPLLTNWTWGAPLLLAFFATFRSRWRWWLALALVLVFAVGPALPAGEHPRVNVLYMVVFTYVPFFARLWFPYRFMVAAMVAVCLLVATAMPRRRAPFLAGVLAVLGLLEQARGGIFPFAWHDVRCPPVLQALSKEGGALMFLPFRIQHDGLAWQTTFRLPTFGGMGESAPVLWPPRFKRQLNLPVVRAMRTSTERPEPVPPGVDAQPLQKLGYRWVVLRRDLQAEEHERLPVVPAPSAAVERLSLVLGTGPVATGGALVVWDLQGTFEPPPAFAPTGLDDDGWAPPAVPAWASGLAERGRFGKPPE